MKCQDCIYWLNLNPKKDGITFGECRRWAPAPSPMVPNVLWPRTSSEAWCGDYEKND